MSNTKLETNSMDNLTKITHLSELKGATPSSMITLFVPPKYCI